MNKNSFASLLLFALFAIVVGCGAKEAPEVLMKQGIVEMNNLADAFERGATAEERAKISERMKVVEKKLLKLPQEEQERLQEKFKEEINAATIRMQNAALEN